MSDSAETEQPMTTAQINKALTEQVQRLAAELTTSRLENEHMAGILNRLQDAWEESRALSPTTERPRNHDSPTG